MTFEDGRKVQSAGDWETRRADIIAKWQKEMGVWPLLIQKPALNFLTTSNRNAFLQHRVSVQVATELALEGYLLVPRGTGPFPAVVVPYYEPESSVGLGRTKLRDFASELAARGFVALAIGAPGGDAANQTPLVRSASRFISWGMSPRTAITL